MSHVCENCGGTGYVASASELRRLRIAAGVTQLQLAAALGVNHTYISHLESGRRVSNRSMTRARAMAWLEKQLPKAPA